ncbi:Ldh family oxidoreductase [Actimicrobium sp. CCC2.4]|uniref:Ldh family oxidoreductase n=1 Tax=Actimicrobium sp. CCC2.4 TaxID=3048606 RepID=UPI002AC8E221|nr:Ldh family oxidoreductase [Actimicrobium sp. CCC2.4]MEB0134000.1 Ldh family oxidoreductase [Actimicrobium sp. CCC2.4]WPX31536.1 Ldh family oxidoreductase [Actimicrobium sp. CCC2.4]
MPTCTLDELTRLATKALQHAGASHSAATAAAQALVAADAQGLASHGVSRIPQYTTFLRNGRTDTSAVPRIVQSKGGSCLVDAHSGMAYEACALATQTAITRAREFGIACAGVTNSNHFGAAAVHLERIGQAGLVGLAFSNSPAAMPAWGGKTALFGTNPVAAIFPRRDADALLIDLALSEAARGKIMLAAKEGRPIPPGWAVDKDGQPTTDAKAALAGSMLPVGGVKGAMLALMVELLAVALTGAAFGFEADSFFADAGNQPRLGQLFLVIDPGALAGSDRYFSRIETLIAMMLQDEAVRLPGERRRALLAAATRDGVVVPDALFRQITTLAAGAG